MTQNTDLKAGLSRSGARRRLWDVHGLSYTEATLAQLASLGDGPVYRRVGGRAVYMPADLDSWAASRIGAPIRKAADARRAKHAAELVAC